MRSDLTQVERELGLEQAAEVGAELRRQLFATLAQSVFTRMLPIAAKSLFD